ncbi:hypothetical protein ACFWBF_31185 [Streptomyces sp. NPDC060028]
MSSGVVLLLVYVGGVFLWFLIEVIRHPPRHGGEENDGVADEV